MEPFPGGEQPKVERWTPDDERLFQYMILGGTGPLATAEELARLEASGVSDPGAVQADRMEVRGEAYDEIEQLGHAARTDEFWSGPPTTYYNDGWERVRQLDGSTIIIEPGGTQWLEVSVDGKIYAGPNDPVGEYPEY